MTISEQRRLGRLKRHARIRSKVEGAPSRPRLSVYRSLSHISAQVIDDLSGRTLVSASSSEGDLRKGLRGTGNLAAAETVGKTVAARAQKAGIASVVFDRGGNIYHGRVKALA